MDSAEVRELTINEILVTFDAFVECQYAHAGERRLSEDMLEGLLVAQQALNDIAAGRMGGPSQQH